MTRLVSSRALVAAIVLVIGILLAYRTLSATWLQPRAEALKRIASAQATLNDHARAKRESPEVDRTLASVVNRTLGGNLETVDHRLRTRLNRLAEQSRLQGVSVGTEGGGKPRLSPARSTVFRQYRALRDEVDFVEVEGFISGVGTLADVVRLMTAITAEPWIKRIDRVQLDPRDNGARVNVSLRLTTLFLPGREPQTLALESGNGAGATRRPEADELMTRYAALVNSNPFRVPPPPEATAARERPRPPPVPAPPPAFAYGEWVLTGVALVPTTRSEPDTHVNGRWEAWLLHRPTGATRVLMGGEALEAMVFVGADGEHAEFEIEGRRCAVAIGTALDQRRPLSAGP